MTPDIEAAQDELDSLGWWYQHFELPNGLWTGDGCEPGYLPQRRWEVIEPFLPKDLTGKTVLDLGGNSGYFSIQMKLRGAVRCVLVDPYPVFLRQAEFAARQFGVDVVFVCDDAHTYCLTTEERFDYVLLLGLLYHLKYPGLVLDRAAEMTKERLYVVSAVIGPEIESAERRANYERATVDRLLLDPGFPKLTFIEELYNNDPTNWWLPNHAALPAMMRSAGLRVIARPHSHVLIAEPERYLGKVAYDKLVFPRYGKRDGALHPGPQEVDAALWAELEGQAAEFRRRQRTQRQGR
ncbi:MAG: TIGR04290 family methyltransferase [Acidobacteria bacterium]|nr:MAG: TIGR04290 family methyltransferase [Acidobacteriota bacterium]